MKCKWYFRNELLDSFGEVPAFKPKSLWKPTACHPCVELLLEIGRGIVFISAR